MTAPAIRVENISKQYQIGSGKRGYRTFREAITDAVTRPLRPRQDETRLTALDNVSFDVRPGEVVGIIGRNGAGKSTLLKILSRITEPTSGRVRLRGRVASLLEVGTGFHHELTGRENLYLNGAILGMTRREVERKFDDIVAFAEVERFIDTPVKRYSSGMYLRLAFSVAAHLEPEILMVDEVLAVGDAGFQSKCLGRMHDVAGQGRTVLFVSHNMAAMRGLCSRCIWIHAGAVQADGDTAETIGQYLGASLDRTAAVSLVGHPGRKASCTPALTRVTVLNGNGVPSSSIAAGDPVSFRLDVDPAVPVRRPRLTIWVSDHLLGRLFLLDSNLQREPLPPLSGPCSLLCSLPELSLTPGQYSLAVGFGNVLEQTDTVEDAISFEVVAGDFFGIGDLPRRVHGPFLVRGKWSSVGPDASWTAMQEPVHARM